MNAIELQQELFQEIKRNIPGHLSATEEIAKVLNVSVDSVYRRMRGEKPISLDELHALCAHYKISLDSVLNIQTGAFSFQGNLMNRSTFHFDGYLRNMAKWLTYFNGFKEKKLYYITKDIPIQYHFLSRDLAAFKYYFWMKTVCHFPEFANTRFSFDAYPDELFTLGKKNLELFNQLPIVEFWNIDIINTLVRQVDYYKDAGLFQSNEDIFRVYDAFGKLIEHLQGQAALGYKYNYDDPEKKPLADYQVFYNEVLSGDNSILVILDGMKLSMVVHTSINYMFTRDVDFNENMYNYMLDMMKKSTRISSVSEKERVKFFRTLLERITRRKEALAVRM